MLDNFGLSALRYAAAQAHKFSERGALLRFVCASVYVRSVYGVCVCVAAKGVPATSPRTQNNAKENLEKAFAILEHTQIVYQIVHVSIYDLVPAARAHSDLHRSGTRRSKSDRIPNSALRRSWHVRSAKANARRRRDARADGAPPRTAVCHRGALVRSAGQRDRALADRSRLALRGVLGGQRELPGRGAGGHPRLPQLLHHPGLCRCLRHDTSQCASHPIIEDLQRTIRAAPGLLSPCIGRLSSSRSHLKHALAPFQ